jgi:hypothetical protein
MSIDEELERFGNREEAVTYGNGEDKREGGGKGEERERRRNLNYRGLQILLSNCHTIACWLSNPSLRDSAMPMG